MGQFKLGTTTQDREKEEAARLREIEAKIQKREQDRAQKLAQLNRKTKTNKAIVITIFVILFIVLVVFGTYNTFFKQPLTEEEVATIVVNNSGRYDESGVRGFLMSSISTVFDEYIELTSENEDIDADDEIITTSPDETTEETEETEESNTPKTRLTNASEDLEYYKLDLNSLQINGIRALTLDLARVDFTINIETKQKDKVQKSENKDEPDIPIIGQTSYTPYSFKVLIANTDSGYSYASDLMLNPSTYEANSEIHSNEYLQFGTEENPIKEEAEEVTELVKIKVDRILSDIYKGKDVGTDFYTSSPNFNPDYTYAGIIEFKLYTANNALGFNSYIKYNVITSEGFIYPITSYLSISQNGDSWKIDSVF